VQVLRREGAAPQRASGNRSRILPREASCIALDELDALEDVLEKQANAHVSQEGNSLSKYRLSDLGMQCVRRDHVDLSVEALDQIEAKTRQVPGSNSTRKSTSLTA
jgi:hypothetical protein